MAEYMHAAPGKEISLLYETFRVIGEGYLPYGNLELLYIKGFATAGSACCGAAECRIIHVPGLVLSRHYRIEEISGNPVSEVEPITDPATRKEVKKLLSRAFPSYLLFIS
ncbi:MAG: hypothetical protein CVU54_12645 [Deltaproteobacteria bacterium HGW-Deltaproteobacteria-12]|jgi:hypothetical protein|nr:MAG: hypothetical protein CVU54_12645 [Deltaproteobacteria bacterium HGW-Deltaproteobacteria-12]